jgi:lipoprotein NlpD
MRRPGVCLICLAFVACAGEHRAPVEQRRGVVQTAAAAESYTVIRDDTLYAIAWRYGIDFRELARINNIRSPYTIYPGQVLALKARRVAAGQTPSPAIEQPALASEPPATASEPPAIVTRSVTKPPASQSGNTSPATSGGAVRAWLWPANGDVIRRFSGTVHKGVDIDGETGDQVKATAAGRVVYAGSGIVGYGKLLIIKHNDVFLSAYGHNRGLLVAEGEQVAAGQQIAEKGSTATNTVKLHFEIRRDGKPVDPLTLLPRR